MADEGSAPQPGPAGLEDYLCNPAMAARSIDVEPAAALYEADAPARELYFIRDGQVRVLLPGGGARGASARLLEILGPGDWCGTPALAGSPTYGSRAVAVTRAQVCQVTADRLMAHLPQAPGLAAELIRGLAGKLQAAHEDAAGLVFEDTNRRLVKTLLQFSRTAAAAPQEGGPGVVLRITHAQLAQAVGAARETVSLALTQLRQQNLLRTGRNRLWFEPDALEAFARRGQPGRQEQEKGEAAEPGGMPQ